MPRVRAAAAACVLVLLAGCGGGAADDGGEKSPSSRATSHTTWKDALAAKASPAKLQWQDVDGDAASRYIVSGGWKVAAEEDDPHPRFTGPDRSFTHRAAPGYATTNVEMHFPWAVVLDADNDDRHRDHVTVYDLRRNTSRRLTGDKDTPPPSRGGWLAMDERSLTYTSGNPNGRSRFCVARVDLRTLAGDDVACAERGHGFGELRLNGQTIGVDGFDDRQPVSCSTLRYGTAPGELRPLKAAAACKGWEVVPLGDGSTFWIQVMQDEETYHGDAYARTPDGRVHALGAAYTGFSTPCGGDVYFVRDNDSDTRSDDLMRWSPDGGLEKVWTPDVKGHGDIMVPPTCGGTNITVGAVGGDHGRSKQLVTARVS